MKKPKTVIAAEAAVVVAKAALDEAEAAVKQRQREYLHAVTSVRAAQTEADAFLPQCDLVRSARWCTGDAARVVILRRTPGGMLVVRYVGDPSGGEYKFKWSKHLSKFQQVETIGFMREVRELRDVPAEYLPKTEAVDCA